MPSDLKKIILGTLPSLRSMFKSGTKIIFPDLEDYSVSLSRGTDVKPLEGAQPLSHWGVRDGDWIILEKKNREDDQVGVTFSLQFVLSIDQIPPYPTLSIQLNEVRERDR